MGCYATRDPQTVARLPGVTHVITDKDRLAEGLRDFGVTAMPAGISRFDGHQRAFIKVQDGCLLNCTYCIIPHVRPTLRSRDPEAIAAEVAVLVGNGCQEIVLTGIHLGHYGLDLSRGRPEAEWCRLWHLLERLNDVPGDFRMRLSSLEAAEARDDLVRALSRLPRVVPHLHLCLQSGSAVASPAWHMQRRRYRSGQLPGAARLPTLLRQRARPAGLHHRRDRRLSRRDGRRLRPDLPGYSRGWLLRHPRVLLQPARRHRGGDIRSRCPDRLRWWPPGAGGSLRTLEQELADCVFPQRPGRPAAGHCWWKGPTRAGRGTCSGRRAAMPRCLGQACRRPCSADGFLFGVGAASRRAPCSATPNPCPHLGGLERIALPLTN